MVMEAPPSPQSVGREFVRQYYTLLNKAPTHLHRFYNNQSSFVHGGLDPPNRETSPVIGQKQIHQKIQQLNFRDCHAKITQVDAQATLGNGVVVQVTGELSNAGQPMRRFTQTFVLAAQSPKKYYVHNDIFRYQDEIVSDDECEPEPRPEIDDDLVQDRPVLSEVSQIAQQPIPYYNPNTAPLQPSLAPVVHGQPPTTLAHVLPAQPIAAINGALHPDDMNVISAVVAPAQISPAVPSSVQPQALAPMVLPATSPLVVPEEARQIVEELPGLVDTSMQPDYSLGQDVLVPGPELNQLSLNQESVMSNEPKTYATLLKSGGGTTGYPSMPPMNPTIYNPPPKSLSPPLQVGQYEPREPMMNPQGGNNQNPGAMGQRMGGGLNRGPRNNQQPRVPRQDSRTGNSKNSFSEDGGSGGYEDRRKSQGQHRDTSFGDSHQLFLGNLPHSATEEELRQIFEAFGCVVDLRIQPSTKGASSGPRAPPNYGFITYENQQAVQSCLAAKPIRYPNNDKNGTVLNVEEKKTKDRLSYGGNRVGPDNMGGPRNRDRDNNGPRRPGPPRGGGGPLGGGPGGGGGRPNNFTRPPPNRTTNNTYNNRR